MKIFSHLASLALLVISATVVTSQSSGSTTTPTTATSQSSSTSTLPTTTASQSSSTPTTTTTASQSSSTPTTTTTASQSSSTPTTTTTASQSSSTPTTTTASQSSSTPTTTTTASQSSSTPTTTTTTSQSSSTPTTTTTASQSSSTPTTTTASQSSSTPTTATATSQSGPSPTTVSTTILNTSGTTSPKATTSSTIGLTTNTSSSVTDSISNSTQSESTTDTNTITESSNGTITSTSSGSSSETTTKTVTSDSTPCQKDPCQGDSSCVNLKDERFCLCQEGYYYNVSMCTKGTIFPGTITVKEIETSDLENKNSPAYQKFYFKVTGFFKEAFKQGVYGQTVIREVTILSSTRSEMRANDKLVNVAVVNIFVENSVTEKQVTTAITAAIANDAEKIFGDYTQQDRCDYYGCKRTNNDNCTDGLQCTCKDGLYRPNVQVPLCVAATCPDSCSVTNHKRCVWTGHENTCECLPGFKKKGDDCQKCSFGYSGVECQDQFQLILTIVGCIAGVLVLGMVIALIVLARSRRKVKDGEEQKLIDNDDRGVNLQKMGVTNFGADKGIFPKVRTNVSRNDQPQNPYSSSRNLPIPDY